MSVVTFRFWSPIVIAVSVEIAKALFSWPSQLYHVVLLVEIFRTWAWSTDFVIMSGCVVMLAYVIDIELFVVMGKPNYLFVSSCMANGLKLIDDESGSYNIPMSKHDSAVIFSTTLVIARLELDKNVAFNHTPRFCIFKELKILFQILEFLYSYLVGIMSNHSSWIKIITSLYCSPQIRFGKPYTIPHFLGSKKRHSY